MKELDPNKPSPEVADPDESEIPPAEEKAMVVTTAAATSSNKTGVGLSVLALLLSLSGLCACGYLWWQMHQQTQRTATRLQQLADETETRATRTQMTALQKLTSALQEDAIQRAQQTDEQLAELALKLQQAGAASERGDTEWRLAEALHLLRIGNYRLQIAHDLKGAAAALNAADDSLNAISEPEFVAVRQQLGKEIAALELAPKPDVVSISLELGQLLTELQSLPLLITGDEQAAAQTQKNFFQQWVSIRRVTTETTVEPESPPLSPYQQLRLLLIAARLAALRLDQEDFEQQLAQASNVAHTHFDLDSRGGRRLESELSRLAGLGLLPAAPDISQSYRLLRRLVAERRASNTPDLTEGGSS